MIFALRNDFSSKNHGVQSTGETLKSEKSRIFVLLNSWIELLIQNNDLDDKIEHNLSQTREINSHSKVSYKIPL